MKRNKKFIIIAVTVATVLALTLSGVGFAEEENGSGSQPGARHEALLDRVCEIYEENTGVALDSEELQNAFVQAQTEMRDEALEARLESLVEQGKITQEEADQFLEWWQSRPATESLQPFRFQGGQGFPSGPRGGAHSPCGPFPSY